jgi:hypothetical protein
MTKDAQIVLWPQPVRILSEREVKRMANAQFKAGSVKVIS